eukprot:CAMPEP_0170653676 /NCGR_PEP_ID=MMETSP0224-20130122/47529_1 /TAXON_ID=285029 /ORGANISM="Togula jolla, Strain CCCM 725" /LENGTH=75 /DNA_ID=CAMNT_0010985553 /DNA_START=633 /DNA_END=860 /DNA_ORIENTATION=-
MKVVTAFAEDLPEEESEPESAVLSFLDPRLLCELCSTWRVDPKAEAFTYTGSGVLKWLIPLTQSEPQAVVPGTED